MQSVSIKRPEASRVAVAADGSPPSAGFAGRNRWDDFIQARRFRARSLVFQALFFVGAPTLAAAIYFGFVASDLYVSEARLTVHGADAPAPISAIAGLFAGAGGGGGNDSFIVYEFIRSPDIVRRLEKLVGLRTIYARADADWLSRLADDASEEDLHEYYRGVVEIGFDERTGISTLKVRAFLPQDAKRVAETIVQLTDELVNTISERARRDAIAFARREVDVGERRLLDARLKVQKFRAAHGDLDPLSSATAIVQIVAGLEADLTRTRAELSQTRSFLRSDSDRVVGLQARIGALEQQIRQERERLASADQPGYSELLGAFATLRVEEDFAQQAYSAAIASLEQARADALRKHRYLVAFVPPTLPDEAREPRRTRLVITVFIAALLIYGIGSLIVTAIREQARI